MIGYPEGQCFIECRHEVDAGLDVVTRSKYINSPLQVAYSSMESYSRTLPQSSV